jgi:hypothetical protein
MKRLGFTSMILVASLGAHGCADEIDAPPGTTETTEANTPPHVTTSGNESTTYDHDNGGSSPWERLDQLAKEGPPRYMSRVHSCPKVRYQTLGRVLASLGVDVANQTDLSAGKLYRDGFNALGGANYWTRIRENLFITTSGASREFDIFAAAADEIIAAVPTLERCKVGGVGAQLFNPTTNACRPDGIACITGAPAQGAHLEFCNLAVARASDVATGKRLAVAAMLAAAYTCE